MIKLITLNFERLHETKDLAANMTFSPGKDRQGGASEGGLSRLSRFFDPFCLGRYGDMGFCTR
jgi:hypothetical protein